jgi:N-acetylmuramic acid 6-phosphate etherase
METERHRRELLDLDLRPTREQVELLLADHRDAVEAVQAAAGSLTAAVDAIVSRLQEGDGRLIYVGAGTAGRLGLLDASEVPPTFDSERVTAIIAGGELAAASAREATEDDTAEAASDIEARGVGPDDVVVAIAASGRTPYTIAAVEQAKARGALTIGIASNGDCPLSSAVDHAIEVRTGPELIAGSTRLKAGTAQKVVLNTLSTLTMVQLGHTFGNLMVDVRSTNIKLRHRARRMVVDATGVDDEAADAALAAADGDHKVAIVSLLAGVDAPTALARLEAVGGRIRAALEV